MKYIRTKDGRVIDNEIMCIGFAKDNILKQADTIEELCDEFVVVGIFDNQIGCCCFTFSEAKELKDYAELPQEQIIYGAIWTEKGLIYVAKMNDKGEWELL